MNAERNSTADFNSKFTSSPLVPERNTFNDKMLTWIPHFHPAMEWLDQALVLTFPKNYERHPLVNSKILYRKSSLLKPRGQENYGDSYESGFQDDIIDEYGNPVEVDPHPQGEVIAAGLSLGLGVDILYRNNSFGGATIEDTISQIESFAESGEIDPTIDRDLLISVGGIDIIRNTVGDDRVSEVLEKFFRNPLSRHALPVPGTVINELVPIGDNFRRLLTAIKNSRYSDKIRNLTFKLLPDASKISLPGTEMLAVERHQSEKATALASENNKIMRHYLKSGSLLINGMFLRIFDEVEMLGVDKHVVNSHKILESNDFWKLHPKAGGHDRISEHILGRCYIEGESESIAQKLKRIATKR